MEMCAYAHLYIEIILFRFASQEASAFARVGPAVPVQDPPAGDTSAIHDLFQL